MGGGSTCRAPPLTEPPPPPPLGISAGVGISVAHSLVKGVMVLGGWKCDGRYALDNARTTIQAWLSGALPPNCAITGYAITGYAITGYTVEGVPLISAHLSTKIFVYRYALDSAHTTAQASLSGALPPNCAITGYAIDRKLLTSVHLSTEIFPNKSDFVSILTIFLENVSTKSSAAERTGC